MDVFVAVVGFRSPDDSSSRRFHPPQDFDLLLDSNSRGHGLPKFHLRPNEHPLDCALRNVRKMSKLLGERAIPVPLCVDKPSSSQNTHSKLICLPIIGNNASKLEKISGYRFCNLSHLLNLAIKADAWLEKESQYFITCLDDWITKNQQQSVEFMNGLFRNRSAIERIRRCVHNPGQNPRLVCFCYRSLGKTYEVKRKSSELEEAVENSNNTRAYMISKEKYKLYLLNPAFGGVITRRMKEAAPDYYAKGRRTRQRLRSVAQSNSWEHMFPLHAACMSEDTQMVKKLLELRDPNEVDADSWTPLQYCTFYNRFEACELLMLHTETRINQQNKTGSTALHFASLNGHDLLVELMLSHTGIDTTIKDINGKTALDLCEQVPKPEWMRIAYLLRNTQLRPEKIEIQLVGRSSLQVKCELSTATAGLLRDKVLKLEGLTNPNASRVFSIWITSERLSLQLKADKLVQDPLERWSDHLDKWGDLLLTNQKPEADIPHLVLRRNAWTLLGDEQALARNSAAVRLLYAEAENNYLQGMYPCKEKDSIKLSAIIFRLLCGAKQSTIDYNLMTRIMPKHMIPPINDRSYQRLINKVLESHSSLPQTNVAQLQFDFLQCCWKQKIYGCTFFKALMYRNKPPHSSIEVFVGLNDFGISVINRQTLKQVESMEINSVELEYESGKNYIQIHRRKHDTLVFNTHQAVLINNLFKQIKTKVAAAQVKK